MKKNMAKQSTLIELAELVEILKQCHAALLGTYTPKLPSKVKAMIEKLEHITYKGE